MNKAFTKEDDEGGVAVPTSSSFVVPSGPFHLTARGGERLKASSDARVREAVARATLLPPVPPVPERATLGVTVHVETGTGEKRVYRLVTTEEQGLLGEGCSVQSPIGRALLGKEVGDTCKVRTPRGRDELEIIALEGDS